MTKTPTPASHAVNTAPISADLRGMEHVEEPDFDLSTAAGGRGYVAWYFVNVLKRHDFTRYLNDRLAYDFACALASHLQALRVSAVQQDTSPAQPSRECLQQSDLHAAIMNLPCEASASHFLMKAERNAYRQGHKEARHAAAELAAALQAAPPAPAGVAVPSDAPDLLPPTGIRNDRDMLNYLMGAFDSEVHYCARCGHDEATKDMDSASLLRDYLAAAPAQAVPSGMWTIWESLPGYLIDHCEGEIISEEGLQRALEAMLKDPQYSMPSAAPAQEHATQLAGQGQAVNASGLLPCPLCGSADVSTYEDRDLHPNDGWWEVQCDSCCLSLARQRTQRAAIEEWNCRLAAAPAQAPANAPALEAPAAPVLYVSPEQLAKHTDPDGLDSAEAGRYLPSRKTPAGKFTQALYAQPLAAAPQAPAAPSTRAGLLAAAAHIQAKASAHAEECGSYDPDTGAFEMRDAVQEHYNTLDELAEEIRLLADKAAPEACDKPPSGWTCSRAHGHDGPCAAAPAAPVAVNRSQHDADSRELRNLCIARDAARSERDLARVEIADLQASTSHLSALMDGQCALLEKAKAAMTALHGAASPIDESGGDLDARIPASAFARFVDEHAALLHAMAQSPVAAPAAPAVDAREDAPIVWPKARDVGRIGDMSPSAHLRIGLDSDNDVYASIWDERGGATVEFCTPGAGGGKSSRTRMALLAVMVAMEADNAADPRRDWWAERNGAAIAAQAKGGDSHE